jgi:hypothetical protein
MRPLLLPWVAVCLLAAAGLGLSTAPAIHAPFVAQEAAESQGLWIYSYGVDTRLRDQLIRNGEMFEDLGGWLVGHAHAPLAERLGVATHALGAMPARHTLVAVREHAHNADNQAAQSGSQLWMAPDGSVSLHALSPMEHKLAGRVAFQCHGAFRQINLLKPMIEARFEERTLGFAANADIAAMVAQVMQQNLEDDVDTMVAFGTRRHGQPGEVQCENYLVAEMNALGFTTSTFNYDSGADVVIGELTGTTQPDKIVIIGGHYDSINYSVSASGPAPGADDDASGVAAVLEIARILSQYEFDYTIRFCGWSGEESGLLGSGAYASNLANNGANVVGMVQLDMIAYRAPGDTRSVDFVTNDTTPTLNDFAMRAYATYVPGLTVKQGLLSGGTSDHRSFFQNGFPACFPFEDVGSYSPYIHTSNDTVGTSANDFVLATQITQGALATVAELARPVSLNLTHQALQDTRNDLGPTYPGVLVDDPASKGIDSVELFWRADGGAWNQQSMQATGRGSEYGGAIPGQPSPTTVEYYIVATDSNGVERSVPEAFTPGDKLYSFLVGNAERIYFNDFEGNSDEGWTHIYAGGTSNNHDDWQRGAPQGKAGDPSSAWSGTKIWGNDIGGSGYNGEYQSNVNIRLISPLIDCTGKTDVRLRYRRSLTVEEGQYDQARIRVAGNTVWENPISGNFADADWVLHDLDISAYADNNAAVELRWIMRSDGGLEFGGWNIDDVEVYALAASNGQNYLTLSGPATAAAGGPVSYTMHGAPAGAPWSILYSLSNSGTTIAGHPFEVGNTYKIVGQGSTGPIGDVGFTANIPSAAAGLTVYVEGASYDADSSSVLDSNLMTLTIQ